MGDPGTDWGLGDTEFCTWFLVESRMKNRGNKVFSLRKYTEGTCMWEKCFIKQEYSHSKFESFALLLTCHEINETARQRNKTYAGQRKGKNMG